jgi:hypothetical protein
METAALSVDLLSMAKNDITQKAGTRYIPYIPRTMPATGSIVVHNHVRSTAEDGTSLVPGMNGFRAWTERADTPNRVVCNCKWAPDLKEHYRVDKFGCYS